ncbi:MAG: gliding motility-associated C-terminal domain-containing protein [Flavobacteriales bacterium]|nr:gliding motility-associated C-terminal domain-containing protein [Flavobacteriales bacterium]
MVPKDDMIQALRERFGEHAMDAPAGAWDAISSQLALGAAATTDLFAEFFRDRFQAHEAEVDPGVWDAIQNSLSNAPADSVNELFRNRFQGHEVEVPAGAWEAIGSQLGQGVAAGTGLSAGWLAASLAGLAGIGVLVWQLGSTEPVVTTTQPKDTFEQAVAPATTEVRADRSAAAQEISSDAIKNPVPAEVPSLGAPGAHQVAAVRSTSAPETGSSVTVTNEVLVPTANEVVPAMAEPAAPERMIPNQVVPAPPSAEGRQVVAAVMEEMTRPQEATAHPVEPEMATATTEIEEEDHAAIHSEPLDIFVPNVFTPNGDGENEQWELTGSGYQRVMVRVFSFANGSLVFSSNDLRPWDGLDRTGQPCPTGNYRYAIELVDSLGHLQTRTDVLTLLR